MTDWTLSQKKSFLTDLLALPPKEIAQVQKKLNQLVENPLPDAKVKKQLKNWKGGTLYRIRCGDYRLFYTLEKSFISLLALRRRSEGTYNEEIDPIVFGGPSGGGVADFEEKRPVEDNYWEKFAFEQQVEAQTPLPEALTGELLDRLLIPNEFHVPLLAVQTEEDLLAFSDLEDELILRIHEALFEKSLSEVLVQPEFIAGSVDDLFRYKAGDLKGFLLKLSPGQEALVKFNIDGEKPTLVKGGPGSGKSTVALYRAAHTVKHLIGEGITQPRILFTTYTNALTNVSNSLLRTLLPDHADAVVVRTADSLVKEVIEAAGLRFAPADDTQNREALKQAIDLSSLGSNALERRRNKDAIDRFSDNYLLDEICVVILAQDIEDLQSYLKNPRTGRQEPLSKIERELIWRISRSFISVLAEYRVEAWSALRVKAERLVASGAAKISFDAVIVDEVQDLEPSMIKLLSLLPKLPGNLFLTADSRQSIYLSIFDWDDILSTLDIDVEISELLGNYRSTEQIDAAAKSYLSELSPSLHIDSYAHEGPLPVLYTAANVESEAKLVAQFFKIASKELKLSQSSCVVLVPTQKHGMWIAEKLSVLGVPAKFSLGRDLDISTEAVKVVPVQSAKGLEFPVVAIAGLWPPGYPFVPAGASAAEISELEALQRRTMFVAMTRAMRALLIVKPKNQGSALLGPFVSELWNVQVR